MASEPSDRLADTMLAAFKIVIAGGFGAGKTTLVGAVSEVQPLHTEEALTNASVGHDDVAGVEGKTTTTVAMDFGRITISDRLVLYLFGTPGQERFWFMWDELSYGALGAVVLADTRRLDDCFPSVDYFEKCGLPFVIAINCFTDSPEYDPEDVRIALDLGPQIPVMVCDARQSASVKDVLITLVEHVLATTHPVGNGHPPAGEPFPAGPPPGQFTDPGPPPGQLADPAPPPRAPEPTGPPLVPQPPPGLSPAAQPLLSQPPPVQPPAPPPVSVPPAAHPSAGPLSPAPPAPYPGFPVAYPADGVAAPPPMPAPPETPAALGPADPPAPPEPPPDKAGAADREKGGWRSPLSRWRASP
jgi:hypothetical protein